MLILQKTESKAEFCLATDGLEIDDLLNRQWLLTNSRGGYSSSSICLCNTRRYHGLLVSSLTPPVNRIMVLGGCAETLTIGGGESIDLSAFEFDSNSAPGDFGFLKCFRRDAGVHFDYEIKGIKLTKSVYLLGDSDTVIVEYDFQKTKAPVEFVLRPLVGLRDFHSLRKSSAELVCQDRDDGILVFEKAGHNCELFMNCCDTRFESDPQWWYNFAYRVDRSRGQEFTEDLWSPGGFRCRLDRPGKIVFKAAFRRRCESELEADVLNLDIRSVREDLLNRQKQVTSSAGDTDVRMRNLFIAADQFVTKRRVGDSYRTTILAGFPWFADWGRDAFLSLPGLLLCTGRFEEAKSVLTTFAEAAEDGMIPNRFDDRGDKAHFNSIDASLWFINAAFQYLTASGDIETFGEQLLPVVCEIIDRYHNGTRFGIHADIDGLITGGSEQSQLTWMDARFEGVSFTPRYGKAVEVNALWYNALCMVNEFYADRDAEKQNYYKKMAEKVRKSFCKLFWNDKVGYLNDCVFPDGRADDSLRPNQIFAVSLTFSPLEKEQQNSIVEIVREKLLTPYGLRSLEAAHPNYKGMYIGPQSQRDGAYHQGTVWAYLIGPFVESFLKVNDFSRKSKRQGREFLEPLLLHLTDEGCLGSIAEIFDGDAPHEPRGCFAQAWSVAEVLRAYIMTKNLGDREQNCQRILQSCK